MSQINFHTKSNTMCKTVKFTFGVILVSYDY